MARRRVVRQGPVTMQWDDAEIAEFFRNPEGPLGKELLTKLGEIELAGAQRRALRRTGRMADEMYYKIGIDEYTDQMCVDVLSPARDPKSGFPYPIVHEGRHVRDRHAHRSLRPALRDIRHVDALGGADALIVPPLASGDV